MKKAVLFFALLLVVSLGLHPAGAESNIVDSLYEIEDAELSFLAGNLELGASQKDARARICGYEKYDESIPGLGLAVAGLALDENSIGLPDNYQLSLRLNKLKGEDENADTYIMCAYDLSSDAKNLLSYGKLVTTDIHFSVIDQQFSRIPVIAAKYNGLFSSKLLRALCDQYSDSASKLHVRLVRNNGKFLVLEHAALSGGDFVIWSELNVDTIQSVADDLNAFIQHLE